MLQRSGIILIGAVAAGCATSPPMPRAPIPNRFEVNGATLTVPPERLKQIGEAWRPGADALAATSRADSVDLAWILNMIAVSDVSGPWPCRNLQFVRIDSLALQPMVFVANDATLKITPGRFNENWVVDACGTRQRWRVMDDSSKPVDSPLNLTVMLLSGTPGPKSQ